MLRATRSGFTLVELIAAIVIMAILGTAISTAVISSLWTYEQINSIADVNQAARAIIERMTREIRAADNADFSNTSASTTLTLYYPAGDPVYPEIITYTIDKNNGQLTYYQSGGAPLYTLLGGTGDDLTVSDGEFEIEYKTIDAVNRPCLVKIYIEFNTHDVNYPFAASACLRRWLNEDES